MASVLYAHVPRLKLTSCSSILPLFAFVANWHSSLRSSVTRAASIRIIPLSALSMVAYETLGGNQRGRGALTLAEKATSGPPTVQRRATITSLALPSDTGGLRVSADSV